MIRPRYIWVGVTVTAIALTGYVSSSTKAESSIAATPVVAVSPVMRKDLARNVSFTAELEPYQEVEIRAKVSGYVKSIPVDIGSQVKAGQILATLDIAEQQADVSKAYATYQQAKQDYERLQTIMQKQPGLIAQVEVEKAKASYQVAAAEHERTRVFASYATITAPFSGVITQRLVDKGALVQAGTSTTAKPLLYLVDNTKLRLVFPVQESLVPLVHPHTAVRVKVQSTGQEIESEIARIAGRINETTRTMEVEVDLDNRELGLTPGMYASVTMALDQQQGVLSVPVQAISGGDKPTLWVVNTEHKIEERPVTLGLQTATDVEISSGAAEGELAVFGSRTVGVGTIVSPKQIGGS